MFCRVRPWGDCDEDENLDAPVQFPGTGLSSRSSDQPNIEIETMHEMKHVCMVISVMDHNHDLCISAMQQSRLVGQVCLFDGIEYCTCHA